MLFRAHGTSTAIPSPGFPREAMEATTEAMKSAWAEALQELSAQQQALTALDAAMGVFDGLIDALAKRSRAESEFWVGIVSTAALAALSLLGVVGGAMLWGGRNLIARPMTRTTGAILALARGDPIGPVDLGSRALGFGTLEQSLERLRRANLEREALIRKTSEQRSEIARNLEALAQTTREMEHQARHDALTGLPNRRAADELMGELRPSAGVAERGAPRDFTLMHIDVDRFKEINDTLGHDAGDAVLRRVSVILTEMLGPADRAFRIGGDEFLIFRDGPPEEADTTRLAETVIEAFNRPIDHNGHACRIGASIGIAHGRDAGFAGDGALVNADIALYAAKSDGKNRHVYFTAPLQERTVSRKRLSDRLIVALENEEFEPFYQPQFHADGLTLRGLETLCRWRHPELGVLPPSEFLGQAEESTLVGKIEQMLLRKASRDLKFLRARGHPIPKISFNVSTDRLMHADFAESLVREVGGDAKIAVELLESMSLDSISETVRWALDALKDRGVGIEIDDFGSCRASIAGLMAIGPDAMKIDGAIVGPITTSDQHLRLVKAIVDIGRTLGIEVVAERVETDEHVRILRDFGCDTLQGYALAKAMPAQELAEFLSGWDARRLSA